MADDVVGVAWRRGGEQRADPFVQCQKQAEAFGGGVKIRVGEQSRNRTRQACAQALVLLVGRQALHAGSTEVRIQIAALVLKERQRHDEIDRGLIVRLRIDKLLEFIERKGECHDVDSSKICRTNNIEMV
jgi:hypothetical protein